MVEAVLSASIGDHRANFMAPASRKFPLCDGLLHQAINISKHDGNGRSQLLLLLLLLNQSKDRLHLVHYFSIRNYKCVFIDI